MSEDILVVLSLAPPLTFHSPKDPASFFHAKCDTCEIVGFWYQLKTSEDKWHEREDDYNNGVGQRRVEATNQGGEACRRGHYFARQRELQLVIPKEGTRSEGSIPLFIAGTKLKNMKCGQ